MPKQSPTASDLYCSPPILGGARGGTSELISRQKYQRACLDRLDAILRYQRFESWILRTRVEYHTAGFECYDFVIVVLLNLGIDV